MTTLRTALNAIGVEFVSERGGAANIGTPLVPRGVHKLYRMAVDKVEAPDTMKKVYLALRYRINYFDFYVYNYVQPRGQGAKRIPFSADSSVIELVANEMVKMGFTSINCDYTSFLLKMRLDPRTITDKKKISALFKVLMVGDKTLDWPVIYSTLVEKSG